MLPIVAGETRIHSLPERPAFMLIREIAEVTGIKTNTLEKTFRRNRDVFPDGYVFVLSEAELEGKWGHRVPTSQGSRTDIAQHAITERGALLLLSFLQNSQESTAARVALIETIFGQRDAQIATLRSALMRDEAAYIGRSKMKAAIKLAADQGLSFSHLWGANTWSAPLLGRTIEDMRLRGFIAPDALFVPAYVYDRRRAEMARMEVHAEDARQLHLALEGAKHVR